MKSFSDRAVILDIQTIRDFDILVWLLCQNLGLIKATAFGAKKSKRRFTSGLDSLVECQVKLKPGKEGLYTLEGAVVENVFWNIKEDGLKLACAWALCEIAKSTDVSSVEAGEVYKIVTTAVNLLERCDKGVAALALFSAVGALLSHYGFPILEPVCTLCGQRIESGHVWVDRASGATYCKDHKPRWRTENLDSSAVSTYAKLCHGHNVACNTLCWPKVVDVLELNLFVVYSKKMNSIELLRQELTAYAEQQKPDLR